MVRVELLEKVVNAKKNCELKNMEEAGKAWVDIYNIIEKLEETENKEKVMHEYHHTMALFSDNEVYCITDYLKQKAGC